MTVIANRVDRLCTFLGATDDRDDQNAAVAAATTGILGRPVSAEEIAGIRAGLVAPPRELLRAIAVHFDLDPRYLLDPEVEAMLVLDHKLGILETARTLGIRLGAVHFRGGAFTVEALELLIGAVQDARAHTPGTGHTGPSA